MGKFKILPRTNDTIFKKIFGDIKHVNIIKGFLQSILDIPEEEYDNIEILDPNSRTESAQIKENNRIKTDKESRLDIRLKTKNGKYINIEIQVQRSRVMANRVVKHLTEMIKDQLKIGDDYRKLQKVICILISAKHNMIPGSKNYRHRFNLYDDAGLKIKFSDLLEVNTLELLKLPKTDDSSKLWEWMKFLKTENKEELDMLATTNEAIREAVCVLSNLSLDEAIRMQIEAEEEYRIEQEDREEEKFEQGIEKGKIEGKIEIAKKALAKNMSTEDISELTGFSIEEINKLQ